MSESDPAYLGTAELGTRYRSGALSPVDVVEACLARIDEHDDKLNAYITVMAEHAIEAAHKAAQELQEGRDRGPLHGIPIAYKDLIGIAGVAMTAASKRLETNVADLTATVAERLEAAGCIALGKTNLQEFARGPTGVDSYFGATSNPWDVRRVPGGSSSGSGAAVAGGLAVAALGSDTGGSVRIPSALCGLVGIRPTYGLVSRYGAVPLGPSYDTIGPMTRSVEDAALLLGVMAGRDPRDPSTRDLPPQDYAGAVRRGRNETLAGIRVGVAGGDVFPTHDEEVETLFRTAIGVLEAQGAEIRTIDIPFAEYGRITYNAVNGPDYGRYHRDTLRTRREELSHATAESFELGLFVPGLRQSQAAAARQLFIRQAQEIFCDVDVIATPTSPIVAPRIEDCVGDCAEIWTALSNNTVAFGAIGAPAMSVPCGFTAAGLPAGMQLVGRWWEEAALVRLAARYEQACEWKAMRPKFEDAPVPDHRPGAPASSNPVLHEENSISEKSVRDWAGAVGLPVRDDALAGLTVRVDRMLASFERLDDLPLDDIEPNAFFLVPRPQGDPAG